MYKKKKKKKGGGEEEEEEKEQKTLMKGQIFSVMWRTSLSIVMLFSVTFNLYCDGGTGRATGTAVASFIVVIDDFCGTLILAVSRSVELLWAMPGDRDREEDGTKKARTCVRIFFRFFFIVFIFIFISQCAWMKRWVHFLFCKKVTLLLLYNQIDS